MYTKNDLLRELRALGIGPGDTLMVHTALRAVGEIDPAGKTTAEVYIDALREAVGEDGLLLIPAHTWANVRNDGEVCDLRETMPCIGAVPTAAVKLACLAQKGGGAECLRSHHPTHSVVAFGRESRAYVENDRYATTPTPWNGSFGKLYARGGKILLTGVDQGRNTFFHAVDEWLDIDDRILAEPAQLSVRDYDGTLRPQPIHRHKRSMSHFFMNYEPYLLHTGAVKLGRLGDAVVRVCDAVACAHAIAKLWENADHDLCAAYETLDFPTDA